nr:hypothetical protein [Tanacetum cinerariifolium]
MINYRYWLLIASSGWSFVSAVPSQMTHLVVGCMHSTRTRHHRSLSWSGVPIEIAVFAMVAACASSAAVTLLATNFLMAS